LIASLAKLARRGSRSRCRLLRRRSGTKSVSPRSSSARRRAIRLWLPRSPSSLCLMARCARGDVRRLAAVFVGSDETTVSENRLCSWCVSSAPPADRRREHRGPGSPL